MESYDPVAGAIGPVPVRIAVELRRSLKLIFAPRRIAANIAKLRTVQARTCQQSLGRHGLRQSGQKSHFGDDPGSILPNFATSLSLATQNLGQRASGFDLGGTGEFTCEKAAFGVGHVHGPSAVGFAPIARWVWGR